MWVQGAGTMTPPPQQCGARLNLQESGCPKGLVHKLVRMESRQRRRERKPSAGWGWRRGRGRGQHRGPGAQAHIPLRPQADPGVLGRCLGEPQLFLMLEPL